MAGIACEYGVAIQLELHGCRVSTLKAIHMKGCPSVFARYDSVPKHCNIQICHGLCAFRVRCIAIEYKCVVMF